MAPEIISLLLRIHCPDQQADCSPQANPFVYVLFVDCFLPIGAELSSETL